MDVQSFFRLVCMYVKDLHVCSDVYVYMYAWEVCNEL